MCLPSNARPNGGQDDYLLVGWMCNLDAHHDTVEHLQDWEMNGIGQWCHIQHGLRVIGKPNGGGGGGGIGLNNLTYFVQECSGSEACLALFIGPAGQGFEGISRTREWKDRVRAMTREFRAGSAKKSECGGPGCPLASWWSCILSSKDFAAHLLCDQKPFSSNLNWLFWTLYCYLIVSCLEFRKLLLICSGTLIFAAESVYRAE
jgi:hypothetical protein